ncbi:hypothetical protein HNP84_010294 [Thermocatellispora tengchongensis]|uniref:Uncharacterized protein n=1 Tax=Thermocatellispora tengchongensis TaxID=1073253 RepID=A0A840PNS7_9ACTN|nr:hypothetical protein [Thermocatellispora tengchongensis]MBB5140526.1 hypothetical protein [Thermocatellispora tengchongensis]
MLDHLTAGERAHLRYLLARILDDQRVPPEAADYIRHAFRAELEALSRPRPVTLVYTGWRGAARHRVREDLEEKRARAGGRLHVIVGYNPDTDDPPGGDRWTYEWANNTVGVTVETHPAPWHIPALSRAAGPYRNGFMLGLAVGRGGDFEVLAHLHPHSKGAAGTAAYAEYMGLRVRKEAAT